MTDRIGPFPGGPEASPGPPLRPHFLDRRSFFALTSLLVALPEGAEAAACDPGGQPPHSLSVFNIKNYCQSGDSGWSPAIGRAVAAAQASGAGGMVFFPPGVYDCHEPVTVDGGPAREVGNLWLAGSGNNASVLRFVTPGGGPVSANCITFKNSLGGGILSLQIQHGTDTSPTHDYAALHLDTRVSLFVMRDVWIYPFASVGIRLGSDDGRVGPGDGRPLNILIDRCHIDARQRGIWCTKANGVWIRSCFFDGPVVPPDPSGRGSVAIALIGNGFDSWWITDCLIESHDTGFRIGNAPGTPGYWGNLWATSVVMDRISSVCVHAEVVSEAEAGNFLFNACTLNGLATTASYGFLFVNDSEDREFRNIAISGCNINGVGRSFAWLGGSRPVVDVTITGNIFTDGGIFSAAPGIIVGNARRLVVSGNRVGRGRPGVSGPGNTYGIQLYDTDDLTIVGNVLTGNTYGGLLDLGPSRASKQIGLNVG